ncbi:MAG TPA: hypothetical protein VGQ89_18195 [Candidatus Limnocylindrales bacterium]|jgi:hypothetical protein|nr:hypothetical protein [Candidatus Limnocylindrales bacterium]
MPDGVGPAIAIGLLIVVMLWFTFGTQRNIRKGNDLLAWLQGGLPLIGPRTTMRWLGSSAVELTIVEPSDPFRDATVVVVLEPRDVGLLWAFARSRGRRDFIILRINLRRPPRFSADAGDPTGWTGRVEAVAEGGWRQVSWPDGVVAHLDGNADEAFVREAWRRLDGATAGVWRLTIQPVVPHLEVHVRPPDRGSIGADQLVTGVVDLARRLAAR